MKTLKIGQAVRFTHISNPEYDSDNNRRLVSTEIEPLTGIIIGHAVRYEGKYHRESQGGWCNDGEYDPPFLAVSRVVILWEVRTGMRSKPLLVLDEHLEKIETVDEIDGKIHLPTTGPKPKVIPQPIKDQSNDALSS